MNDTANSIYDWDDDLHLWLRHTPPSMNDKITAIHEIIASVIENTIAILQMWPQHQAWLVQYKYNM